MRDKDGVKINIGDTIKKDEFLFIVKDFIDWGLTIEIVCVDKLSLKHHCFLSTDVIKICARNITNVL